ncbi:MAG: META domain-containing protein [Nocardioides sp.]
MRAARLGAASVLLLAGLLAGCGASDNGDEGGDTTTPTTSPTPSSTPVAAVADLDGTTYESTSVEGHELVPGEPVRVAFEGDTMSVSAGCNTMFGADDVSDGMLAWSGEPASSLVGCEPELADQDAWLADLFTTGVEATLDGSTLTLTSGDVVMELTDVAETNLEDLLGRTWTVRGIVVDGATSRVPSGVRNPTLVVSKSGLSRLDTGCNTGRTRVTVDAETITFAPPPITRQAGPAPARGVQRAVLAVVDGTSDHVWYRASTLVVTQGDRGLVFEVS